MGGDTSNVKGKGRYAGSSWSAAVSGTSRARGGIPGSSSMIPTDAGRLNLRAPAPPGFMTVTTWSTVTSSGRWV